MQGLRGVPTSVNRQPAVAFYHWQERDGAYLPLTLDVLRVTGGAITEIVTFHADRFPSLELPERLPAGGTDDGRPERQPGGRRGPGIRPGRATPTASAGSSAPASLPRSPRWWPPPWSPRSPGPSGSTSRSPTGGETIPLTGIAVVTGFFSLVGVVIAAALLRWSARPAERFVWTAVSLTAISLVPPLLAGADAATTATLIGLHLVAATVMVPALARTLRTTAA